MNTVSMQTWYLREVLVVLMTGRLERLSSISTSELVAELSVETETLPLLPSLPLQSLISDFLNQGDVNSQHNYNVTSQGQSVINWLTIMSSSFPT